MKRGVLLVVVCGLCLWGAFPARAAETLTLDQALMTALEKNPGLRIALQSRDQARYNLHAAWSRALPALSAGGNYQRTWDRPEIVMPLPPEIFGPNAEIRTQSGADHTMSGMLILEQPLYAGGAIWAGIGIARDSLQIAEYSLAATSQQTLETVYSAFYGVLLAQSLLAVSETAVQNAQINLDQVENRYEAGAASRFELLRAQVQLSTIRPGLMEGRNRYNLALERLKDLLGMDKRQSVKVEGAFEPRTRTLVAADLEGLIGQAYDHRPEYRIQGLQKEISEKRIRMVRAEFLPTLALSSAVQWQALRDDLHFAHDNFERSSYAGVTLRIPLFNGFGSKARYSEARAELQKSEIQEANLKNLIATEIRSVHDELAQSAEILESQGQVMEQAREGLRLANLLYAEGAATLLEVIDAQLALTQASTSYFRAIYNFNTASIKLERACGILKAESILDEIKPEAP
ncbi:MAG: TolC family protein [Smithellaceae bacterium]